MEPQSLSVVVPNYNHARFLEQSLTAILAQSYPPHQVVVVDDASGDDSVAIVTRLMSRFPALQLLRNPTNRGVCHSLARGLETCKGEYLYCASADDLVLPGFFEKSIDLLSRFSHAGLCCAPCSTLDEATGAVQENRYGWSESPTYFSPSALAEILNGDIIPGHTAILRRSAFFEAGGPRPELRWHWDWFLNLVVGFRHGVCFIPEAVALLRPSPNSFCASGRRSPGQDGVLDRLLYILADAEYRDVLGSFQKSGVLKHFAADIVRAAIRNRDHWEPQRLRLIQQAVYQEGAFLAQEDDPEIREGLCLFAGALGRREGDIVAVLLGRLQDADQYVRFAAADALGKISGDGGIRVPLSDRVLRALLLRPPLTCLIPSGPQERGIRQIVRSALGRQTARYLTEAIADRFAPARRSFQSVIDKATRSRGLTALPLLTGDGDERIRQRAAKAMEWICMNREGLGGPGAGLCAKRAETGRLSHRNLDALTGLVKNPQSF